MRDEYPTPDGERRAFLEEYVTWINSDDLDTVLAHMPRAYEDQDDRLFDRYFDLLQSLYLMPDEVKKTDEEDMEDLREFAREVAEEAKFFGLSTMRIRDLL